MFVDETEATKAANAKLDEFKRGKSRVRIEITGHTSMGAWAVELVIHTFANEGYSTSVEGAVYL